MKIRTFDIDREQRGIEYLLNNDNFEIKKIMVFGKDNRSTIIFYKLKEEQLTHETARLEQIKEVAESIRRDKLYSELKNANQRCLYLLDNYHIPKSIALDVIDEVKVLEITEK